MDDLYGGIHSGIDLRSHWKGISRIFVSRLLTDVIISCSLLNIVIH
jgi:hypothetical protein